MRSTYTFSLFEASSAGPSESIPESIGIPFIRSNHLMEHLEMQVDIVAERLAAFHESALFLSLGSAPKLNSTS